MADCKHIVGYTDEGYDGLYNLEVGDEVYSFESVVHYAFCPLCGEKVDGDMVTLTAKSSMPDGVPLWSPSHITRVALSVLTDQVSIKPCADNSEYNYGDSITIRMPTEYGEVDG